MSEKIQRTGTKSKEYPTVQEANNAVYNLAIAYPVHKFSRIGKVITVHLNEKKISTKDPI